jgi:hypothetical protein
MPKSLRTARCSATDARLRLRTAQAYMQVAAAVADEPHSDEYRNVATGLAVLAGIAAADAVCGLRLGVIHRGDDHHGAIELIRTATADGSKLAVQLQRLLMFKDAAHYGLVLVSARDVTDARRWAGLLVQRAAEEADR